MQKEKSAKPGRKQKKRPNLPNLAQKLRFVVDRAIPKLSTWIGRLSDPRDKNKTTYGIKTIIWSSILFFVFQLKSRRHFKSVSDSKEFLINLNRLTGEKNINVPHPDTLAYLLTKLPTEELNCLPSKIVHEMQGKRMLEKYRLKGHYMIAMDGTGIFSFTKRHCENCLTQTKNGKTIYFHKLEEAKLVSPGGLALSVGFESIENPTKRVKIQDCELRAFYRLAPKIKTMFPHTKICLLLDSLYATEKVFAICKENNWEYIIVFKEGSMPKVFEEFETLRNIYKDNRIETFHNGEKQILRWVSNLSFRKYKLKVLECEIENNDTTVNNSKFVWLTNFELNKNNVTTIANNGGRCRWVIENQGFNVQKNCEFQLEHVFTHHETGWKNYYSILQIAHLIFQLMYWWRALRETRQHLTSIYAFARRILEHFRTRLPEESDKSPPSFQLRLDTS